MERVPHQSAAPAGAPQPPSPPYRYDPNFGDPRATYTPVFKRSAGSRPELTGRFVKVVEGETYISTMHGHQTVKWRTEPGSPCMILGYWSDGSVHVRWPAI